jgi:exonuclease SbcD
MRILHTSDWHLGKTLGCTQIPRIEEQQQVLDEICEIAEREKTDVALIAGDLFDSHNPGADAIELFYKTLKKLANGGRRAVVAIAGNHDSPDRIEAPDPLARECGILFAGYPHSKLTTFALDNGIALVRACEGFLELKLPNCCVPLRLVVTPYANEQRLKSYLGKEDREGELRSMLEKLWSDLSSTYCDDKGVNILVSHLFMQKKGGPVVEEPEGEKSIAGVGGAQVVYSENVAVGFQYVALGHLHRQQQIDDHLCPIVYSGSPLAYSMSEANQDKFVVIVDVEPASRASCRPVKLTKGKRLFRKQFANIGSATEWLKDNPGVLVELTMATETYITAEERKLLVGSHDGIVDIVPMVLTKDGEKPGTGPIINLRLSVEELFVQYFQHEHDQLPNKQLMDLLREIVAENPE